MQAATELVALIRELAPGVQGGQDNLDPRQLLLGVQIDGHAAPVIGHADSAIAVQHNVDLAAVPRQCLVDRVIDDFLGQMIRAGGVGIHAGTGRQVRRALSGVRVRCCRTMPGRS